MRRIGPDRRRIGFAPLHIDRQPQMRRTRPACGHLAKSGSDHIRQRICMTDHRIELTLYNLPQVMEGEIECVLDPLMANDMESRLSEMNL